MSNFTKSLLLRYHLLDVLALRRLRRVAVGTAVPVHDLCGAGVSDRAACGSERLDEQCNGHRPCGPHHPANGDRHL